MNTNHNQKGSLSAIGHARHKFNVLGLFLLGLLAAVWAAPSAMAQATPTSTLTDGINSVITEGTAVGIAALGIFVAFVTIMAIKKFFFAGK